ncbi:MAG: hypothetical protein HKN91_09520 [Acidimicrobiia bacterium]|nr:hypothetical protein [Acidimicrobiia bacterium]
MNTLNTSQEPITNPEEFRSSPRGHVYGIVDDPAQDIPAVTADLLAAQIPLDGIHVYCCTEGVKALDPTGAEHGLRARIVRLVQSITYTNEYRTVVESALEKGHALVGVAVDEEHVAKVATILGAHGGHDMMYYGRLAWRHLGSSPKNPE